MNCGQPKEENHHPDFLLLNRYLENILMKSTRQSENVYSKRICNSKMLEAPQIFTNRRTDNLWSTHGTISQWQ